MKIIPLENQRQVHLDFHTSPYIEDVGCEFDSVEFAATMLKAHVNSVTVFAKCHHGMCYYPTKTGVTHPAISERDLLGEQIQALHRVGIRAPIYTTIVWEEDVAQRFPQWRQMTREGHFAGLAPCGQDNKQGHVGAWLYNEFLHPDYQDYIEAHVREIFDRYESEVDGLFFDILFYAPNGSWSDSARLFRQKHGLMADDQAAFDRFQGLAQQAFARKFTHIIQGLSSHATIFYNSNNDVNMHRDIGPRIRMEHMTHFEIESLPSGHWGYYHFSRMARALSHWGKPWLGMTGRFQKMWGDFGGIKPLPALEFECFRSQALGGGNSIGDQLPPRGRLDQLACDLIGSVYSQCGKAEPFYEDAEFIRPRIGIFSANYAGLIGSKSEEGAVLLCEESHYDCAMLDSCDNLDPFELLILPDTTIINPQLADKLRAFVEEGGRLIVSYRGGFDAEGNWSLPFLPIHFRGEEEKYPTYWRVLPDFIDSMAASDRVFYEQGMQVTAENGSQVLVQRVLPYFKRSAIRFSSHFQTPPVANPCEFPAVVRMDGVIYFSDPIFREYRQTGNIAVKQVWQQCMRLLVGPPPFGPGLAESITVYPLRKGNDLLLTLLHYIPVRKAIDIDIIDQRGSYAGEVLMMPPRVSKVSVFGSANYLTCLSPGRFALPDTKGRLLLEVPGYFAF